MTRAELDELRTAVGIARRYGCRVVPITIAGHKALAKILREMEAEAAPGGGAL